MEPSWAQTLNLYVNLCIKQKCLYICYIIILHAQTDIYLQNVDNDNLKVNDILAYSL